MSLSIVGFYGISPTGEEAKESKEVRNIRPTMDWHGGLLGLALAELYK